MSCCQDQKSWDSRKITVKQKNQKNEDFKIGISTLGKGTGSREGGKCGEMGRWGSFLLRVIVTT